MGAVNSTRRIRRFVVIAALTFLGLGIQAFSASSQTQSPENQAEKCGLLISPRSIKPGDLVRILAASEIAIEAARFEVMGPSGAVRLSNQRSGGGPPFWRSAEFRPDAAGAYTVALAQKTEVLVRREVAVLPSGSARPHPRSGWRTEGEWDRSAENLYSAWLEALFQEADEQSSWKALHEVTRDARRNLLFDHLGLGEDDPAAKTAVILEPDCADAPYFLRAYFAWKMRLPFGFRECSRGWLGQAPRCPDWFTNASQDWSGNETRAFDRFLVRLMNAIHSGTARTFLEDDQSDSYPVPLTRRSLRPGVVFADPYGHTLVVVRWLTQTNKRPGQLLAVDAQPDATVGLRRFWRGNILFNTKGVIGNPGFKAFRPIRNEGGRLRPLTNEELRLSPDFVPFSLQQKNMDIEAFYGTMDRLINPAPLEPAAALRDLFTAFHEQIKTRVLSVANAEDFKKAHPGTVIPMPSGTAAVFQDMGQWEDFSTPNRDMRLLIAMDVLLALPDRIVSSPEAYILPARKTADDTKKKLEGLLAQWAKETTVTYTRSDGSPQTLTVEDILKRGVALEMAYNPNDCIEVRWGAPQGSPENATCGRRAPGFQRERMLLLRHWFQKRLRPPT